MKSDAKVSDRVKYGKLVWRFAKNYKWSFLSLYICLFTETVINTITPIFIGFMIDSVIYRKDISSFFSIALIYAICMGGVCILYLIHPTIWQYLTTRFVFDVRLSLYKKIIYAKAEYLGEARTGDLMHRINGDASEFINIIQRNTFHFFNSMITVGLSLFIVFKYNYIAGLIILVLAPISYFVSKHFGGNMRIQSQKSRIAYGDYVSWVFEVLKGLREIRILASEKATLIKFVKKYKSMTQISIKTSIINFKSDQLINFVNLLASLCLYVTAAILVFKGHLTIGAFVAMLDYFNKATGSIGYLIRNNVDMQNRMGAVDRVYNLLEETDEKDDKEVNNLEITDGKVEFANISFSYKERKNVIKDLSFKINSGQHIAIVGASGCGKTTLTSLLLKFYKPQAGKILIDGQDISSVTLSSIRKNIGIVQQETLIFSDTIRMNLKLGNKDATDEEILVACDKAAIGDFIRSLPMGLDTILGKDGVQISGGQRQRIAIARIYLRNPKILIFDEATSSLDYEAEKLILNSWNDVSFGKTTISIAHRLTTVLKSDKIAVMSKGEIVAFDTHLNLMKNCPEYIRLFDKKYMGNEEKEVTVNA